MIMKNKNKNKNQSKHIPVLLQEVLEVLEPKKGEAYLDLTSGYGGHASAVLNLTKNFKDTILCDQDSVAIEYLDQSLPQVQKLHMRYTTACQQLLREGKRFDLILADIGVSSQHLDMANRGFSVIQNGPLDMRMDQSSSLTADDLVNESAQSELETILRTYGEEPKAKSIARAIVENRPIKSTSQLAELVKRFYPHGRHHPAIRTFQALRIAVNDELNQLSLMLPDALELLNPGGRLAIITFHSLEDRIVKKFFAEETTKGYEAVIANLTKKPLIASQNEISFNPRARSAKLRAVVKK